MKSYQEIQDLISKASANLYKTLKGSIELQSVISKNNSTTFSQVLNSSLDNLTLGNLKDPSYITQLNNLKSLFVSRAGLEKLIKDSQSVQDASDAYNNAQGFTTEQYMALNQAISKPYRAFLDLKSIKSLLETDISELTDGERLKQVLESNKYSINSIKTFQDGYVKQAQVNPTPLKVSRKMGVVENNEIQNDGFHHKLNSLPLNLSGTMPVIQNYEIQNDGVHHNGGLYHGFDSFH